MQFTFTQIASYRSGSYSYQAVLLDIPIWRIFPQEAYKIMFLSRNNSQQGSQYTAYLHILSETGERLHTD